VAVKIAGTTVITDSRAFTNITSTTGSGGDLHSTTSIITSGITFTAGIQTCIMTANQTFTISGSEDGRTTAVLLDTGTTPYVPTFPSSIIWNGGEPTWSTRRYWQISIMSRDTYQVATAIGYGSSGATPPTETIALEGTSGSPVYHTVFAGTSPMVGGWKFDADGNVYTYDGGGNIGGGGYALHSTSSWNNITPSTTFYIRLGFITAAQPLLADSINENQWYSLAVDRKFWWRDTANPSTYGDRFGTVQVEIATTASASTIVATGYYKMFWIGTA